MENVIFVGLILRTVNTPIYTLPMERFCTSATITKGDYGNSGTEHEGANEKKNTRSSSTLRSYGSFSIKVDE